MFTSLAFQGAESVYGKEADGSLWPVFCEWDVTGAMVRYNCSESSSEYITMMKCKTLSKLTTELIMGSHHVETEPTCIMAQELCTS